MEPRRRDTRSDGLSPTGSGTGRAIVHRPVSAARARARRRRRRRRKPSARPPRGSRKRSGLPAPSISTWSSPASCRSARSGRRPISARARSTRSPGLVEEPRGRHRGDGLRALAGAAAQSGEGLERQGARPHRADPGNLRPARAHPGGRAAGRARASDLPEEPAGAVLDPSRAPARRLRLPRRSGRDPDRGRPAPDRGAHRAHRGRAREGQAHAASCIATAARACRIRSSALVGYTNAGKSTLFNRMTRGERAAGRHAVRHARSDAARGRAAAAARRSSCPTRSASSPTCRPCWSPRSAPRSKR